MKRISERKIVMVKRKTRLEDLIVRYNTVEQARFYIEHLGADFSDYEDEHYTYHDALSRAEDNLSEIGRVQILERVYIPSFIFGPDDIVVAIGQDGLVANTLKYLRGQPLIGVNPDPARWDGVLLPFGVHDLGEAADRVVNDRYESKEITLGRAVLNDGRELLAVNDFFIGQRTHISARYEIRHGEHSENQSSSGIIVSTGLGSTGWLKSVLAGAEGVARGIRHNNMEVRLGENFEWGSRFLYFSVREPFPSKNSGAEIVFGRVDKINPLAVVSHMPENGVIFSDGIERDFLRFNSGMAAEIGLADFTGKLVV
jgi:NAD kinase